MATFLENLTLEPENIRDLRQLINLDTLRDERIQDYFRVLNARHGDPVGLIGKGAPLGVAGCGCGPTYESWAPDNALKRWDLGCWEVPITLCWKDMEGTIAEYALKNGTPIGDLNGTQIMSEVIYPLLSDLYVDLVWRLAWFGDTATTWHCTTAAGNGTEIRAAARTTPAMTWCPCALPSWIVQRSTFFRTSPPRPPLTCTSASRVARHTSGHP